MDKLVEFLIKKVPYVLAIILGFIAPGNILLLVWDTQLYMEMDVVKLLILSFGITYTAFIPNTVIGMLLYFIHKSYEKNEDISVKVQFLFYFGITIVLTAVEILTYVFFNLCGINQPLSDAVFKFGIGTVIIIIILIGYKLGQIIKSKINEKSNQPSN